MLKKNIQFKKSYNRKKTKPIVTKTHNHFKVLTYTNPKLVNQLEEPSEDLDTIFDIIYLWDYDNKYTRYLEDEDFRNAFRANNEDFLIIDWLFINDLLMLIEDYSKTFLVFFQKPNDEIIKDLSSFNLNEEEKKSITEGYSIHHLTLPKIISERSKNFIPYYMIEAFNFAKNEIYPPSFRAKYKKLFLYLLRCLKYSIIKFINSFEILLSLETYFKLINYRGTEFHLYRGFNCESCPITKKIRNNEPIITSLILSLSIFENVAFYYTSSSSSSRLVLDLKIPQDKYGEFKYAYISANRKNETPIHEFRRRPIFKIEDGNIELLKGQFEIVMNYGAILRYLGESIEPFHEVEYTIKKYEFMGYNKDKSFEHDFDIFYKDMTSILETSGGKSKRIKRIKKY